MKILIAIPSKDRVDIFKRNAWQWLIYTGLEYKVFIEPQDQEKYKGLVDIVIMDKNNQGLGYAKQCIKQYAQQNGYDFIFKVDDDVRGFTNYRKKLPPQEAGQWLAQVIEDIKQAFEQYPEIKAVGFPYSFEMYEKKHWEVTKRLQTAYIVRTQDFHVNPGISVFEDFAAALSIIAGGGIVMRYGLAGIDMGVKVGGGTGGHQSFDRFEQAKKELDLLRKIYPPLNFRKVDKPWKIEPDIGSISIPRR